jgi:hypothetical protein
VAAIGIPDTSTDIFVLCTKHAFDYEDLLPAIFEVISGYSLATEPEVEALVASNFAVDALRYIRRNFWIMSDLLPHREATLAIEDTISADEFTAVGDMVINPEGMMLYARCNNPLLGDLLGYSYKCMAGGDPWTAAAAIQSAFLINRMIMENVPPNLTTTTFSGVTPYVF